MGGQSVADRWTYLSHLGLVLGILSAVVNLSESQKKIIYGAGVVAVFICFQITSRELPYWRDSETLFTRTLEASPQNFMAHTNLGDALSLQGRMTEAAFHFEEAVRLLQDLEIRPDFPEAKHNLDFLENYLTSNCPIKAE